MVSHFYFFFRFFLKLFSWHLSIKEFLLICIKLIWEWVFCCLVQFFFPVFNCFYVYSCRLTRQESRVSVLCPEWLKPSIACLKIPTWILCAISLAFVWSVVPITGIFMPCFRKDCRVMAFTFSLSVLHSFCFLLLLLVSSQAFSIAPLFLFMLPTVDFATPNCTSVVCWQRYLSVKSNTTLFFYTFTL